MLAGLIQSPTYYNPAIYPKQARRRRNVVLEQMYATGLHHPRPVSGRHLQAGPHGGERPHAAPDDRQWPRRRLLHELGQRTGGRTYGTTAAYDGRPADQDDPRSQLAARGRRSRSAHTCRKRATPRRRWSRSKTRPARSGRWWAGATTTTWPVQHRHPRRAPTGVVLQGLRPGCGARGRISPESVWTSKVKEFPVPNSK